MTVQFSTRVQRGSQRVMKKARANKAEASVIRNGIQRHIRSVNSAGGPPQLRCRLAAQVLLLIANYWSGPVKNYRIASGRRSHGFWQVDLATIGTQGGGTGNRTDSQLPNRSADAKKNKMNTKRNLEYWVIPPEANAEFAAHMEDVLDVYSRPYNAKVPVLCMDEQPVQLVQEIREPIAATAEHPKRVDYEYKRAGVANVFMFAEPLASWRQVSVRTQKTKVDWASEMGALLEGRYADCEKVIVVCDNLNTHTIGAFYEVF